VVNGIERNLLAETFNGHLAKQAFCGSFSLCRLAPPRPFQTLNLSLQTLNLLLHFLDRHLGLRQLRLQLGNPLSFRDGLGVLVPSVAHHTKFTAFDYPLPESFGLSFSAV
jgi:hypothetical protein